MFDEHRDLSAERFVLRQASLQCVGCRSQLALGPTTVLIKASRSAALERVVQALIAAHTNERPT